MIIDNQVSHEIIPKYTRGRHGSDCMVVGFITTFVISAYHH